MYWFSDLLILYCTSQNTNGQPVGLLPPSKTNAPIQAPLTCSHPSSPPSPSSFRPPVLPPLPLSSSPSLRFGQFGLRAFCTPLCLSLSVSLPLFLSLSYIFPVKFPFLFLSPPSILLQSFLSLPCTISILSMQSFLALPRSLSYPFSIPSLSLHSSLSHPCTLPYPFPAGFSNLPAPFPTSFLHPSPYAPAHQSPYHFAPPPPHIPLSILNFTKLDIYLSLYI